MVVALGLILAILVAVAIAIAVLVARTRPRDGDRPPRQQSLRDGTTDAARREAENTARGERGETFVRLFHLNALPPTLYRSYDRLYIPRRPGDEDTTEIDHVVVSKFGIFVIETKNWRGRIFGQEDDREWTVKLGRHPHQRDNPIVQNRAHARSLVRYLDVPSNVVHSVVVFTNVESSFAKPMPDNVLLVDGLTTHIGRFRQPVLADSEVERVNDRLTRLVERTDPDRAREEHLRAIEERRKRAAD